MLSYCLFDLSLAITIMQDVFRAKAYTMQDCLACFVSRKLRSTHLMLLRLQDLGHIGSNSAWL